MSVVLPFFGDAAAAREAVAALRRIALRDGDELVVADNTPGAPAVAVAPEVAFATRARRSPYGARNEGALRARNPWLLFVDADCRPRPDVLDAYFAVAPGERVGAVAGEVEAAPGRPTLAARYGAARGLLRQGPYLRHPYRPMAVTANLLVRREAWAGIGGFQEGMRSGGDADLSWRLQAVGWALEHRPAAIVEHVHRDTVRGLLRQVARTSAGVTWLERRHPGSAAPLRPARGLLRAVAGMVGFPLLGRPERGAFKAVDAAVILTQAGGRLLSNAPPPAARRPGEVRRAAVFPAELAPGAALEGFAGELPPGGGSAAEPAPGVAPARFARAAGPARVEAVRRPVRPRALVRDAEVVYAEDDGALRRLAALAALALQRPALARGTRPEAAPAALRALRDGGWPSC